MPRFVTALSLAVLILIAGQSDAASRKEARITKIGDITHQEIRVQPSLATADTCIVRHDLGIVWKIDGWVTGNELYKGYIDPGVACPSPYPFLVTEINMPMYFYGATPLNVSVDVEAVDNSTPGCPVPGELLTISSEYQLNVPGTGLYDIWIPLDTPVTVTGPFFAGFFISNVLDQADSPAVVIDSLPVPCTSYNIWDTEIGWIDLTNNSYWNFPGRLVLYVAGVPAAGQPMPEVRIASPHDGDTLYGSTELWAGEGSGSSIIDYVSFEYKSSGGTYIEIGRDFDGTSPLRDGVNPPGDGAAYNYLWDFSSLAEGTYTLRYTVVDTLGQSSSDSITVYLEPTPPTPSIISPSDGETFCSSLDLLISNNDENLSFVQAYRKQAANPYSCGMATASTSGFGAYYNAPLAAALLINMWYGRGYERIIKEGYTILSVDTLAARLAVFFHTEENNGTYDEDVYIGLQDYLDYNGSKFHIAFKRDPNYFDIRKWVENEERGVMIAIGGPTGFWVAVDGFVDWEQADGSYHINVSNPLTGTIQELPMRQFSGKGHVYINGTWQQVDMMISLQADDWMVTRNSIGADLNGADGWAIHWTPSGLTEDNRYFFLTYGNDTDGLSGTSSIMLHYTCALEYTPGDYNDDGQVNILDLEYLLNYIALGGPPPAGGAGRADANCDNHINIADVVYYMNYIFGSSAQPCY